MIECGRVGHGPAAADEPGAIRLILTCSDQRVARSRQIDGRHMNGERRLLLRRPQPPPAEQGARAAQPLRLEKELAKSRCGQVFAMRAQRNLGIAGHL